MGPHILSLQYEEIGSLSLSSGQIDSQGSPSTHFKGDCTDPGASMDMEKKFPPCCWEPSLSNHSHTLLSELSIS